MMMVTNKSGKKPRIDADHDHTDDVRPKKRRRKKLTEEKTRKKMKKRVEEELHSMEDEEEDDEEDWSKDKRTYSEQIAAIARADPELFEFLKREEADLLEEREEGDDDEEELMEEEELAGTNMVDQGEETFNDGREGEEEEEEVEEVSAAGGEMLSSGNLRVQLRTDPETGRALVDRQLLTFLDVVMNEPAAHRKALPRTCEVAIKAFVACVARVGGAYERLGQPEFMVQHEKVFDEVIRLCFQRMCRCLYLLLNPVERKKEESRPSKKLAASKSGRKSSKKSGGTSTHFKHWHKYGAMAKSYLAAVQIFLDEIQSAPVLLTALRAVTDLADLYLHFPKLCKTLIKTLVQFWSRKAEEVRCISFVALCKIARLDPEIFPLIYKGCYTAYIANCKIVDDNSLPFIAFMQSALVELTFLHPGVAYQYAFVYIRQFAIHLRNAMIAKRKDLVQTVYNWQFVKGLQLWSLIICEGIKRFHSTAKNAPNPQSGINNSWFRELIHPLVEVINSLWRLFPTPKFLPLRVHSIRMLLRIQRDCDVFIPTLAFTVELLDELAQIDAKKPGAGKGSTREPNIERMLRLSAEQLEDAGVRHHLGQQLFGLMRDCADTLNGRELAAVEIAIPVDVKLRRFLKTCANREHVRLFSQLKGFNYESRVK